MDVFKVYHIPPFMGIGMPLLITAIMKRDRQWLGEMYILLEDEACSIIEFSFTVNGAEWPQERVVPRLNADFFETELKQQAQWRLYEHLYKTDHDRRHFLPRPEFMETSTNALAAFWMRDRCGGKIKVIRQRTQSQNLANMLSLVETLPRFQANNAARRYRLAARTGEV